MESREIRKKFLDFFEKNGHTIVPSSSLIPDDPSVLLTTAGMQQFKKYYTGDADPIKDFGGKNTASVQKCFRTSDIDEVGDDTHLTFFEMLGNFSFGGYFKEEAIRFAHEFLTKELGISIAFVTVFEGKGEIGVPEDTVSAEIWKSLDPDIRVEKQGMEDVFWGPTGSAGPCGPTTEIYCTNANGQDVEVWNLVFNEFFFAGSRDELLSGASEKKLEHLQTPGVDTGMGFERLAMIVQKKRTIFETDLFAPLLELLLKDISERHKRIIADHLRGSAFLLADGVRPSNKEAGYILRRLLRRAFVYEKMHSISTHVFDSILHDIVHEYGAFYPELLQGNEAIREEFKKEREKFGRTIERGMKELGKIEGSIDSKKAFQLYETFGIPYEIIKELGGGNAEHLSREGFDEEFKKHQEISRAGQEKKFGGHGLLLDTGELKAADEKDLKIVTRLHTATHLLQAALRKVLGPEVTQRGSDITAERTRFDFSFSRKMTPEEIRQAEDLVNDAIRRDLAMGYEEMTFDDAVKSGALHFFREKYPERVKVYSAHDQKTGEVFSREFCGGPHVSHTGEIGHMRIVKEEASSAGVRRIRAVID